MTNDSYILHVNETYNDTYLTLNDSTIQPCSNDYCISDEDYLNMITEYVYPTPYEWALISLHAAVFIVGIVGNALVCVSVYRNPALHTVTNLFIVNLAVADFLVILVCLPPSVLWDVTETWFFGSLMCKLVLYLQSMSVSVSVLTLTFISMDRWYAICRPLRFKSTAAKARTAIGVIWAVSGVLVLPEALVLETRAKPGLSLETELLTECYPTWSPRHSRNYQIFLVTVLFVLPFILMSVAYYQIARVLWNKNIPGASETSTRFKRNCTMRGTVKNGSVNTPVVEPQIRSRRKAAKMLIAVVVMFGLCYVPVHLINTLRYTVGLPQNMVTTVFALLSHWLCYFNSAVNPVIYNVMNGKFRKEFKNVFTCHCLRTRRPQYQLTSSATQWENINLNSISPN